MTAPSVVVYKNAFASGSSSTRVLTQITVATGDVVVVVGQTEDFTTCSVSSLAKTAGTSAIGTVTKQQEAGTASHCGNGLFTFTVTSGGTLTLTATFSITPSGLHSTFWTYVATGGTGVGNTGKTTTSTTTITTSLATSANSCVVALAADWSATGGATTTLTPSSPTPVTDAHEQDGVNDATGAGSVMSSRGGHWADTGTAGTASYGVTVPTSTKYNLVVCELLGSAGTSHPGTAALTGVGTLTGAGVFAGTAALSGVGTLTGTGTVTLTRGQGVATLTGSGTLTGTGTGVFIQVAGLSGQGTLTGAWIGTLAQVAALDGNGTLQLSGVKLGFTAGLAGNGTLSILQATGGLVFASPGAGVPYAYPLSSQVMVAPPGTSAWRPLGSVGAVTALTYSFTCPGGADQMTCTVQVPAAFRTQLFNPGWQVKITRGGHQVWSGKLDEPQPSASGWTLTAVGTGNRGTDFTAVYTSAWPGSEPDQAINNAISRGLPWINPGVGTPSGAWFGQAPDSASQTITQLLNLICTRGKLTWYVNSQPGGIPGDDLAVFPLPTVVNRLLVCTDPVGRTLGGDINTIWTRYQSAADDTTAGTAATYGTTSAASAASVAAHGVIETFIDLSSAGTMTQTAAQGVANSVLAIYQRASFAGPFTARYGQLTTTGGVPVDPGTDQAGTVVKLILTDFGFGGEVLPNLPITFIVGGYTWDDLAQTATITPYQTLSQSLSGLLSLENTELTPITVA